MKMYTEEFKKAAIQKVLLRGNRSVKLICEELGVSSPSIYEWKKEYGKRGSMNNNVRPQDRSPTEKFKAVMEFDRLEGQEQGEFLRREGFCTEHIEQWRGQMLEGLEIKKKDASARAEVMNVTRENRDLKKELQRKESALAETAALLILKKKADLIWGSGESE